MTTWVEKIVKVDTVRMPRARDSYGSCLALGASIRDEGMRHSITLWKDGTLISGGRRVRAHMLMEMHRIRAVHVDTIEDAAKALTRDNEDDYLAVPQKWSEVCRLWELLRRLDEPAAVLRADAARRWGVELRRQTFAGERLPGRTITRTEDHVLGIVAPPFGVSESTARRLWAVYGVAHGLIDASDEKRQLAHDGLRDINAGDVSIFAAYRKVMSDRSTPAVRKRQQVFVESADAARQLAAWSRALPEMEGLVAGLTDLGPPNTELTWDQVAPVHARLKAVRREIEKIINKMRETAQS